MNHSCTTSVCVCWTLDIINNNGSSWQYSQNLINVLLLRTFILHYTEEKKRLIREHGVLQEPRHAVMIFVFSPSVWTPTTRRRRPATTSTWRWKTPWRVRWAASSSPPPTSRRSPRSTTRWDQQHLKLTFDAVNLTEVITELPRGNN